MLHPLSFNIDIKASKEEVWEGLWSEEGYPNWTSVFSEGGISKIDFQLDGKFQFISKDGEGLHGYLDFFELYKIISFKIEGDIVNGINKPFSEENLEWAESKEIYKLFPKEDNNNTSLKVEMTTTDDFVDFFKETFPKGLKKLKAWCEKEN